MGWKRGKVTKNKNKEKNLKKEEWRLERLELAQWCGMDFMRVLILIGFENYSREKEMEMVMTLVFWDYKLGLSPSLRLCLPTTANSKPFNPFLQSSLALPTKPYLFLFLFLLFQPHPCSRTLTSSSLLFIIGSDFPSVCMEDFLRWFICLIVWSQLFLVRLLIIGVLSESGFIFITYLPCL